MPSRSIIILFTVSIISQVDLPLRYMTGCLYTWEAGEIFFCFFNVFNFQVSHEKVQKNLSSGLSNGRSLSQILITVFIHGLKRKFMENCFTLISAMKGNKKSYSVFHNQNLSALWN